MATHSLRSTAASCLSVSGSFSVKQDVFGYIWGPIARDLSVRRHLELIEDQPINLCIFLVGHEPGFGGWWLLPEVLSIQFAIDVMRELYAQVGVGVRRLFWRYIDTNEATGYWSVDSAEATDLTQEFSGPNDGIDVFYVKNVSDAGGWSNSDGPCDKDADARTGAVLELASTDTRSGILLAHEVGHYLTLPHAGTVTNVMGDDSDGDGIGTISSASVDLTAAQGNDMKASCFIRPPC